MSTIIFADGASKNNPGEASAAAVVVMDGNVGLKYAKKLGVQTNNVAEYHGLILALLMAGEIGMETPVIRMDSNLVVQQFLGNWKCNEPALRELLAKAREIAENFEDVDIAWVPREENIHADQASNDVLDGTIPENSPLGYLGARSMDRPSVSEKISMFDIESEEGDAFVTKNIFQKSLDVAYPVTSRELQDLLKRARAVAESDANKLIDELLFPKIADKILSKN